MRVDRYTSYIWRPPLFFNNEGAAEADEDEDDDDEDDDDDDEEDLEYQFSSFSSEVTCLAGRREANAPRMYDIQSSTYSSSSTISSSESEDPSLDSLASPRVAAGPVVGSIFPEDVSSRSWAALDFERLD